VLLPESKPSLSDNPYWVFISFLYAWIAADIAGRFSQASFHKWEHRLERPKRSYGPVFSHLTLAGFIVGTSWLGWTGEFRDPDNPLSSVQFGPVIHATSLLLVVDFWILATYFIFTAVVNQARLSGYWRPLAGQPAFWVCVILTAYFTWDLLVFCLLPQLGRKGCPLWEQSWMSVLCAGLALAAFFWLKRLRPDRPFWVVVGDISLTSLVLLYRALKQLDSPGPVTQMKQLIARPLDWKNSFAWVCIGMGTIPWLLAGWRGSRPKVS
jgi:hypothetical protein